MAYCGTIQAEIISDCCPLRQGVCMWQHRVTQVCKFTSDDLTATAFAERVGLPPADAASLASTKTQILSILKQG